MGAGKIIAGIAAAIVAAEGVAGFVMGSSSKLLRPPGIQSERDFMARCIKCGKCVEACPYAAIRIAGPSEGSAAGTPFIDAREQACRLCPDFPCVEACPTDALRDVAEKHDPHMGYAKIEEDVCIAFKGYRCEVCYRVCPLIDEAITIDFEQRENDDIHAKFIPVVHKGVCTGCGLCVERCAVSEPYVPIRIVTLAEDGAHTGGGGKGGGEGGGAGKGNGAGNGNGRGNGESGNEGAKG
jgi:ferredoxin-type protein NapG